MGTFYVAIQVADRFRERYANIDALVDTGSSYSSLPESLLDELGIERDETRQFELADNRIVEYPLGETRMRISGREKTVPVMFAPDDTMPLVGATTLEILGLGIDPLAERLVPVNALGRRSTDRLLVGY
jgi:clan AA aspartic protease